MYTCEIYLTSIVMSLFLPNEILAYIFNHLSREAVLPAVLVCWHWRNIIKQHVKGLIRDDFQDVMDTYARQGDLKLLQWARTNKYGSYSSTTCQNAARGGHLETVKWLHRDNCPWDEATCAAAARGGHLDVLQWARENGCPWDEETCAAAASGGHLDVLQWARENGVLGMIHVHVQQKEDIWKC